MPKLLPGALMTTAHHFATPILLAVLTGAALLGQDTLPSGTILEIRLTQPLSSYMSQPGTPILAEVIAPVAVTGRVIVPRLTKLRGTLSDVRKVGIGFSRETALLHLHFDRIQLPGRPEQVLLGRISHLDNARERVDNEGRIRGIRATNTFANTLAGVAIAAASFDPLSMAFAFSATTGVFRIPDASIVLPAGTEMKFRVDADVKLLPGDTPFDPAMFPSEDAAQAALGNLVRSLPFRTTTKGENTPSDLTSLLYFGSKEAVERAFAAAGWVRSDRLDGRSKYGVMRSIIENQGYRAAPMSILLLDGNEPALAYAKTLNTFFSRHHLRIYGVNEAYEGKAVWTSTATYDSGIGFSTAAKTFVHLINENIDEERSKVVNDLLLTGCVDGVAYLKRPWVPLDAKNATGDWLRTDGRIAILNLNECEKPRTADGGDSQDSGELRQSPALRPLRSTILTLRNDLLRGNVVYQAYSGFRLVRELLRARKLSEGAAPRSVKFGGQEFLVVRGAAPARDAAAPSEAIPDVPDPAEREQMGKSYASRILFSISGGLSGYGNSKFSTQSINFSAPSPGVLPAVRFDLETRLSRGWSLSPRATFQHTAYISHEFGYSRTTTNFQIYGVEPTTGTVFDHRAKAIIRRYSYNTLIHVLPNGKRFRPYVAVGPALQLTHLSDAKAEENRLLRLAARDIALLVTAYNFGSKSALEGGGVFQAGLQYGGGARFHVTPRFFVQGDFRETLSGQQDFWKDAGRRISAEASTENIRVEVPDLVKHGLLRHQLVTLGVGVAF